MSTTAEAPEAPQADATGNVTMHAGSAPGTVSRGKLVLRRFLRNKPAIAGLVVLALMYLTAYVAPLFSPWTVTSQDTLAQLAPPSPEHWFGTTQVGGDVFVQTMTGLEKSLTIGLTAAILSTLLAAVVGAAAGYFGGWSDRALMWIVDLLLVLPSFLILAIMSPWLREQGLVVFTLMLAAFLWMIAARIVRGNTLTLREREYVKAAKFMGASPWKIIFRHILPNMASLLIIDATVNVAAVVLTETGLSYFGFGVQPPDVSLGTLIHDGAPFALTSPWLFLPAALLLILALFAVSFIGDGLRDAFDPSSSRARAKENKRKAVNQLGTGATPRTAGNQSSVTEDLPGKGSDE